MEHVRAKALAAKKAALELGVTGDELRSGVLTRIAAAIIENTNDILKANAKDVERAANKGTPKAMLDRLRLDAYRIEAMAAGLRDVAGLPDPLGSMDSLWRRPNGLRIGKKRVPLGVIGIIYEARPNVTADAIALCIKSGNAVVLRGGSEAIDSNREIVRIAVAAAESAGMPKGAIQLIDDTSREAAEYMMGLHGIIDVLIPRGGAGLIASVIEKAKVPCIETGVGNCHIYVEASADADMAKDIIINAKTSRPSVCNAAESLLIDRNAAENMLHGILTEIAALGVEIRGCEETRSFFPGALPATDDDYQEEYLDYVIAVKVVSGIDEAIEHIEQYGTKHSECIITRDYFKSEEFLARVDAAALYVNASTRFTDGGEFGLGAEMGISTQKLHARGPMGLAEMTTYKYVVYGEGQVR
ncbi:MAG: glutamate-5-semialdehyde dehydrogenase [Christensenellales bacterium]|jgi:glutamate-5-semialdehyde dehydrogenase